MIEKEYSKLETIEENLKFNRRQIELAIMALEAHTPKEDMKDIKNTIYTVEEFAIKIGKLLKEKEIEETKRKRQFVTPVLNNEERVVLQNLGNEYKWMEKDENSVRLLEPNSTGGYDKKIDISIPFPNLFQNLPVGKTYRIKDLLAVAKPDKNTPTKPDYEGDSVDSNNEPIYDTWICPNCETKYELEYEEYKYCPKCGQAIDWSKESEEDEE